MSKINTSLEGKVAIVTGGSKGIGRAAALNFAAHGANVTVVARSKGPLEITAKELEAFGKGVLPISADVGAEEDLKRVVDQTVEKFGGVDILMNNAAQVEPGWFDALTYESFERLMRVNTWSGIRLAQLCLPSLRKRGGGVIINISSDDSLYPSPGIGAYSMTKIAQVHFTKQMAVEWGKDEIRVVCISPSLTRTELAQEFVEFVEKSKNVTLNPLNNRICEPEEVAALCLFVASPAGSFINGYNYVVDGGCATQAPVQIMD